jgi:hypothetical protein
MCLKILGLKNSDTIPEPQIANKNIFCYKIFKVRPNKGLVSPYRNKEYEIGIRNYSRLEYHLACTQTHELDIVDIGIHSFIYLRDAIIERDTQFVYQSVHIVKCMIPKGAKYYTGVFEYNIPCRASTELIPIEVIN